MNRFSTTKVVLGLLGGFLAARLLVAQIEPPIPNGSTVPNWTVPAYHDSSIERGLSPMTDISSGISFVAMTPCRVFDTRNPNGAYGGPRLVGNTTRNFDIDSGPCGPIPSAVEAYSMNFGAILPDGANSFITIWPTGTAMPTVSSINPIQGAVVANAAIVPAGTAGAISVFPNTGVHLYGDINGYFTDGHNAANVFQQSGLAPGTGMGTFLNASTANDSAGVLGLVGPGFADNVCCGPGGVIGKGAFNGVAGVSQDRATVGVLVDAAGDFLAEGQLGRIGSSTTQGWGVRGINGAALNADDSAAVRGDAFATSNRVYGVRGFSTSTNAGASGVIGFSADASFTGIDVGGYAGVIGMASAGQGVRGITSNTLGEGTTGFRVDGTGAVLSGGVLGYSAAVGVYFMNGLSGTGTKSFIEPHPTDASKIIKYISLEGNEPGTYFRGRARFENGIAVITVPEDFRMVTDPEGLTVQVTPIGAMASVGVIRLGLDEIVVQSSRDVEFSYMVNGVRRAYKDVRPIVENDKFFVPESPEARLPAYLSADERQRLIDNGTYRPDGRVNMETAERLGWTRIWEEGKRPVPRPEPSTP